VDWRSDDTNDHSQHERDYTVTVTDVNSCSASTSQGVTVNPLPVVSITPSGPTTFCAGGSVNLTARPGGSNVFVDWWSNDTNDHSQHERDLHRDGDGREQLQREHQPGCDSQSVAGGIDYTERADDILRWRKREPARPTRREQRICGLVEQRHERSQPARAGPTPWTVTDGNSCSAASQPGVTVQSVACGEHHAERPTTFCAGGSVNLTATRLEQVTCGLAEQRHERSQRTSGTYTVTVTDVNSCSAQASQGVTVNPLPVASITRAVRRRSARAGV